MRIFAPDLEIVQLSVDIVALSGEGWSRGAFFFPLNIFVFGIYILNGSFLSPRVLFTFIFTALIFTTFVLNTFSFNTFVRLRDSLHRTSYKNISPSTSILLITISQEDPTPRTSLRPRTSRTQSCLH